MIERQLGAGSMGAVYLAYDQKLESRVALKTLLSVEPAAIYRFKKEFRSLADVSHRNLITLHELFSEDDQWFFTMEYVEGVDLLTYVHGGRRRTFDSTPRPISERPGVLDTLDSFETPVAGMEMLFPSPLEDASRLRAVLEQVVEGLMAVHAAGKLHRDLKPENVLVTADGRAVLCDFGIVIDQTTDIHETLATVIGTPAYMSPEQCRGEGVKAATDWYALGVILYEALTGDVPFDGTPMQVITRKQQVDPPPPSAAVSDVPEDLDELCMQLLQREPRARPGGQAILRALRTKQPASVPAPTKPSIGPVRQNRFVGREAQLRDLEGGLTTTEAGQPVVALVSGASGIGKTTLVNRFLEDVSQRQQAIVLKGRCYERESVPFKAFDNVIDTLSRYLRKLPAVDVARMMPRDIDALAGLFPVLKRVEVLKRSRRTRALPPDPQELRQRAFRALKEMFCRIADLEPLVVYVDDLQWSDVESAKLLAELVTGADRPAMLLICAYRSDDSEHSDGLKALREQIGQSDELQTREIQVGVLNPEESFQLAKELLGGQTGEEGARKLGFESKGNPHLLTQLVGHVTDRRAEGSASPDTAQGLINFERVLEERLASLSTDGRTMLELLSVAGRPVPESMLTLVSSFNIDLPSALAELRSAKLIRGVSSHDIRAVEVYHDTIREGVTSRMAPETLTHWHRRLAAALEASGAIDLEALTSHLLGAGEQERASLYAARAGEQAEKGLAFEKAARLYGLAAEHSSNDHRRLAFQRRHADALVNAGRGSEAAEMYFEAARTATSGETAELRALGGIQLLLSGQLEEGLAAVKEPLQAHGVQIPRDFAQAAYEAGEVWRALRTRGLSFQERAEADVEGATLVRLDMLWGATRGLLLHELARPLPLLTRYVADALETGEPLRVVRALTLFHTHVDLPFSRLANVPPCGALDVAEAVARGTDSAEARACIAFARGLVVYYSGQVEQALGELFRAEELYRNHTRGGAFEMRQARMVIGQLQSAVLLDADLQLLRDWAREADGRNDVVSSIRLRMTMTIPMLRNDDAEGALATLDQASKMAGTLEGISFSADLLSRSVLQLYRGDAERARTTSYLFDQFTESAENSIPLWRGLMLLCRARLLVLSRASRDTPRSVLDEAGKVLDLVAALELPCLQDQLTLARAAVASAAGDAQIAIKGLEQVLATHSNGRTPPLTAVLALRAKGQLVGGAEGESMEARADQLLRKRQIANPRRFARLMVPLVEEAAARQRSRQTSASSA